MKLRNFVSTTFLVALLTVVLFVGVWQIKPAQASDTLIDSYSETNQDNQCLIQDLHPHQIGYTSAFAQSFTCPGSYSITSAKFYLKKNGSPIGLLTCRLYAISGTYGTNSTPTGSALAISEEYQVSTLTTSFQLIEVAFNSTNQYAMSATYYAIAIGFIPSGTIDADDYVIIGVDASAHSHSGNVAGFYDVWTAATDYDTCFYVYGKAEVASPTYLNVITNQTAGNYTTHFNVTVADETGLATTGGYIFGTNNSGVFTNETWMAFASNPETVSVKKVINGTFNNVIVWQYWFNDTSNNWNNTGLQYSRVGYQAIDGTPTNVQSAISIVTALGYGDIIIPAGNWTWNSAVTISTVTSAVGFNLLGALENETIFSETEELFGTMLTVSTNEYPYANPTRSMRFSNLWFNGHVHEHQNNGSGGDDTLGSGLFLLRLTDFRVDHCKFTDFPNSGMKIDANTGGTGHPDNRGIIDHCSFDNPYKTVVYGDDFDSIWAYGIVVVGPSQTSKDNTTSGGSNAYGNYGGHEHGIYNGVSDFGGGITYVENNWFNRTRHAISIGYDSLGYYVARYNVFENNRWYGYMDIHGGGFGMEAYNNTCYNGWDPVNVMWNPQGMACQVRGGYSLIYNNTFVNFTIRAIWMTIESTPYVDDTYIWGNTLTNSVLLVNANPENIVLNVNYFLSAKQGYTAYPYPHPFISKGTLQPAWDRINSNATVVDETCKFSVEWQNINNTQTNTFLNINTTLQYCWLESNITGSMTNNTPVAFTSNAQWMNLTATLTTAGTVWWRQFANNSAGQTAGLCYQKILVTGCSVNIISPTNITFTDPVVSVQISASGGTIDEIWWNCTYSDGTPIYANTTYTVPTIMTLGVGNYIFYAMANNTDGEWAVEIVAFTVEIGFASDWGGYWGGWWGYP